MTETKNALNTHEHGNNNTDGTECYVSNAKTILIEEKLKKQVDIYEKEFNLNHTPLRKINTVEDFKETNGSLDITPVNNYFSEKRFNTRKRKGTPLKRRSSIIKEKEQKTETEEAQGVEEQEEEEEEEEEVHRGRNKASKTNLKKKNRKNDTFFYDGTPKKRKVKDSELTPPLLRKDVENNEGISFSKKKKLNDSKYDSNLLPENESNFSLETISFKKVKKKKQKKSVNDEVCQSYASIKKENKNLDNQRKHTENNSNFDIIEGKWEIDDIELHDLPAHVKSEYVSYLCSPLKRSERIIKTKINKMLNTHKKNANANADGGGEGGGEVDEKYDEDIVKYSKDVNKMACDFFPKDEERCWDEFYTQSVDKAKPFTGITTETAVHIITQLLKPNLRKIKVNDEEFYSPISENDTVMEIGHGTHPLAVEMQNQWGTVGRYIGIEFSGAASAEALKCRKLKQLLVNRKVEFIKILNMNYYENDSLNGVVAESTISTKNTKTDFIKMNSFKYIFAKSTLDYITCRLDNTGNSTDWDDDLQISPTVVQMFNSLSDSLQNCGKYTNADASTSLNGNFTSTSNNAISKKNSYIIFVEPSDPAKFRDHILTIFKVIYTATFKYNSSAKYLKLVKILNINKASGYMIEKRNEVFQNFEEMRQETTKLISKSSYAKYINESDWFLPTNAPKKWISNNPDDIEYLVNLDNTRN